MIRLGRRPGSRWLHTDRALAVALTRLDATTCDGCGMPVDQVWDTGHEHTVTGHVCEGCAALERDREKKHPAGWKAWVVGAIDRAVTRFGPGA